MNNPASKPSASRAVWGAIALLLSMLFIAFLALIFGNGAAPQLLADPGPVVRWGLPLIRGLQDLATATAIGSLALACFAGVNDTWQLRRLQNLAAGGAAVWALSGVAVVVFTYLSVTSVPISTSATFTQGLWLFTGTIALGQALALNTIIGAITATAALMAVRLRSTLLVLAIAVSGLVPLAVSGHASGSQNHAMAVNAIGLHLLAVTVWVGGLVAVLAVAGKDEQNAKTWISRYSSLALMAFAVVAVSGLGAAMVRITTIDGWFSNYGLLVLFKAGVLIALGLVGAWYRLRLSRATQGIKTFWQLAIAELALMGGAMGLATALARTAPPGGRLNVANPTPAQLLTGAKLPPELTAERWLTAIRPDLIWLLVCLFGIGLYLVGVWRLRRRGDSWPAIRTLSWVAGMLALLWITNGSMNVYEEYLFSVHMIAHMSLTMAVPVLLVPGAPVTLISRAVEKRTDGSWGVREWVLWAVHTPWARLVSNPIFASINFAASLVIFYFTPLFGWATRDHLGHEWMVVHFLITGYLFVQALVGVDPGPKPFPHAVRLIILLGTLTFHALFGLALMQGSGLLLPDWYGAMGRTWGQDPLTDQQTGGAIAWGIGEFPAAILTLLVSVQWSRSDAKEAKRKDRASDRAGNRDVEDYNQMLERLAARGSANEARRNAEFQQRATQQQQKRAADIEYFGGDE